MKSSDPTTLSRAQSRNVDDIAIQEFCIPGIVLMENAGRGCVDALRRKGCQGPVVICVGPGNNGGDGFVIARQLALLGIRVKVLLTGTADRLSTDARTNFQIAEQCAVEIIKFDPEWSDSDLEECLSIVDGGPVQWIVDALLGTGATGNPRQSIARVIKMANEVECKRCAVDLPSGLDCDTGIPGEPCFQADLTCTFVASKTGFERSSAAHFLGTVEIVHIGLDSQQLIKRALSQDSD